MKKSRFLLLLLSIFTVSLTSIKPLYAQQEKANTYLAPVGGGAIHDTLLLKIVKLSSVENPKILIIPYASSQKDVASAIKASTTMFTRIGKTNLTILDISNLEQSADLIKSCEVIWMSGGGQDRLRKTLENAGLADKILERYKKGNIIISGTSAGASVMTDIMMSKSIKDKVTGSLTPELSYGLKLWPEVIIDQHFSQRKRLERLQKAVALNTSLLGIGIDEGTAIFYQNDGKVAVWGRGTVTFLKQETHSNTPKETVLKDREVYSL